MYRRKVMMIAAAVFAVGAAFAAQPTSVHADWRSTDLHQRELWAPGANMLMSAHESSMSPLAPPR
jgi:hypothetical protein